MPRENSTKFISRNRAPRVHIEYEIERGDATEKIQLPFIIGVMADLSGESLDAPKPIKDRRFAEVDQDNFNDFMLKAKPRVAFQVKNTLTGEGNLNVDLTFSNLADFSPAAVARKVEALSKLFAIRNELDALLVRMDGRDKAEQLLTSLLNQPALLKQLAAGTGSETTAKQ